MRPAICALLACLILAAMPWARATTASPARGEWHKLGAYRVTGYCPCVRCCGKRDGITEDGTYAPACPERIVAAPRGFPFGTRLWIEGVGPVTVHDRGGAIRGRRMDLFFATDDEAVHWGARKLSVFLWTGP